jgi:hypothetical protein
MSRPALEPTQFPIPWVLGFFHGCKVVRHNVNQLSVSRVSGAILLLPNCAVMVFRKETSCILYVQFMIAGIGSKQLAITADKFHISCLIFLYSFVVSSSPPGQNRHYPAYFCICFEYIWDVSLWGFTLWDVNGWGWWTFTFWSKSSHYRCHCIYIMRSLYKLNE